MHESNQEARSPRNMNGDKNERQGQHQEQTLTTFARGVKRKSQRRKKVAGQNN